MSSTLCNKLLHSTWEFRVKINSSTNVIIKFKALFYAGGRCQELYINHNETHDSVVKLITMRTFLCFPVLHKWYSRAIGFDQACTQDDCDTKICLRPLVGCKIHSSTRGALKILRWFQIRRKPSSWTYKLQKLFRKISIWTLRLLQAWHYSYFLCRRLPCTRLRSKINRIVHVFINKTLPERRRRSIWWLSRSLNQSFIVRSNYASISNQSLHRRITAPFYF